MLFVVGITKAEAAADTFTITVTCNFIEVNLRNTVDDADYGTWAVGSLATSGTDTMTDTEGVRAVRGTSSQNTTLQSHVSGEATDWTIGGTISSDVYKLEVEGTSAAAAPAMAGTNVLTTTTQTITTATNLTADWYLYYKFTAPSATTTGDQQSITVTVTVIVAT